MKIAQLLEPRFNQTLERLMSVETSTSTAFKLASIKEAVSKSLVNYDSARQEIRIKLAAKDDKGIVVTDDNGLAVLDDDGYKKFSEAVNGLINIDIDLPTLTLEELKDFRMTANELIAIRGLFDNQ